MGRPSPGLWVSLIFLTTLSILWELLILTACVPPLAGNTSLLSNFHLMELTAESRTVRFGYFAFCTTGESKGKAAQICAAINKVVLPSPKAIASKLPNVDPQLFNMAFFLNRTAFPVIPAVTLTFLVMSMNLLVVHWIVRQQSSRHAQKIMAAVLSCLGIAMMLSLVSAVALTLTTSAITNVGGLIDLGFTVTRGELAFRFHWLAFANTTVVMIACAIILPMAKGKKPKTKGDYVATYNNF